MPSCITLLFTRGRRGGAPRPAGAEAAPPAPPAAGAPRPTPPFTMASDMNTPPEHRTGMAKQGRRPTNGRSRRTAWAPSSAGSLRARHPRLSGRRRDEAAAGNDADLQVHYTAGGKPVTDRSKIGFVWAKSAPRQELVTVPLINGNFTLPAGAPNTKVDARDDVQHGHDDLEHPAAHPRPRQMEVDVTYPDGRKESCSPCRSTTSTGRPTMSSSEPLKLPKGTSSDVGVVRQLDPQQVES